METHSDNDATMILTPIGRVHSDVKSPMLQAGESDLELAERMERIKAYYQQVENSVGQLVIFDAWADLLDGIEGFSHIMVLYWPHLIDPQRRNLRKVHPMGRKDMPLQGIFATRSPARPNPVLVSVVRLLARIGNTLKVAGLDAVDGSPIIDLKPYLKPHGDADRPTIPEWMVRLHRDLGIELDSDDTSKGEGQCCCLPFRSVFCFSPPYALP